MSLTEWPSLIPDDDTMLQPGMVLTLEPSVETADGLLLVHEENIVVTDGAARLLTTRAAPVARSASGVKAPSADAITIHTSRPSRLRPIEASLIASPCSAAIALSAAARHLAEKLAMPLGIETLGYELAAQAKQQTGRLPDVVIATHAGGGNVTGTDFWGKRRFAYEIDHMNEGYYSVLDFEGETILVDALDRPTPETRTVRLVDVAGVSDVGSAACQLPPWRP